MFDHVNFQVSNLKKSRAFYRAALTPLGLKAKSSKTYVLFKGGEMQLGIIEGRASKYLHLAFKAHSQKAVDKFYKAAIKTGGTDNGRPGPRDYKPGYYYAAFVLDSDGNNIEAAFHKEK